MTHCRSCSATLGLNNISGLCRSCNAKARNADPAERSKQQAGVRRRLASDPELVARKRAVLAHATANLNPEQLERRRERARVLAVTTLRTPQARAALKASRSRAGQKRSDTVLAWCPPEWRDKYRDLKKRGRTAAAAKQIVLGLMEGKPAPVLYAQQKNKLNWCPDVRREEYEKLRQSFGAAEARRLIEADMTPFERQLARVAAGANLIEVRPIRRSEPAMTLGGVSSSYL